MMLNMLTGISGSGKSTYAKLLEKDGFIVLSSDSIRKELYGDESIQKDPATVFKILHERIITLLKAGKRVCYDATNINRKKRMVFLEILKENRIDCFKKCTVIYRDINEMIEADSKRERSVGIEVIMRQLRQFEIPTKNEGWDGLFACTSDGSIGATRSTLNELEILDTYDQGNHHHSFSLGTHLRKTQEYTLEATKHMDAKLRNCVIFASTAHDFGKPFTKILNKKGEYSYYSHQNVGAYISFLYSNIFHQDEMFMIAWLVQYHMEPFFWETEKQKQKFIDTWGQAKTDLIITIHEADKKAH